MEVGANWQYGPLRLWLGEERSFARKVEKCGWEGWERWVRSCSLERTIDKERRLWFDRSWNSTNADCDGSIETASRRDSTSFGVYSRPAAGRSTYLPWAAMAAVNAYDAVIQILYMRKSFRRIRDVLGPDSVMFLGDLFDGGREWGNEPNDNIEKTELVSKDREWRRYGQDYWLKEYRRFGRIFFDTWLRNGAPPRVWQRGRKFIASLPGNHDLGLGIGIRLPARQRFTAFFGDENRIDVIGNHSFVSFGHSLSQCEGSA